MVQHARQPATSLQGLRGHVVLVDFWTYTCINCIRTLPYLKSWDQAYRSKGLTIVGVETPEFPFEREAGNVRDAISQFGLHYPVVQDNRMGTWNAYGNEDWPADYLIDAQGRCATSRSARATTAKTETAIRALLAEGGATPGAAGHPRTSSYPPRRRRPRPTSARIEPKASLLCWQCGWGGSGTRHTRGSGDGTILARGLQYGCATHGGARTRYVP